MKSYFMGTHQKCLAKALLAKALLMSTHNICLCGEIRKISQYQPLSGAITIELVQKLYIYAISATKSHPFVHLEARFRDFIDLN